MNELMEGQARELAPLTPEKLQEQINLIQQIMKNNMQEGQHYGIIPGCQKPSLLKPGAEKLSLVFRLRPIMDNDRDVQVVEYEDNHREVRVFCHILNSAGQEVATGVGSASTKESKHRYRGGMKESTGNPVPKEYWNLKKKDPSKAFELIGGQGFGTMKDDTGTWVICEVGEKMENPDIADTFNTVLKMAKKRAYVDGILSATAASDIFTQDIEDFTPEQLGKAPVGKPEVQQPQEVKDVGAKAATNPTVDDALISEPQRKRLFAIMKEKNYPEEKFLEWLEWNYRIDSTTQIKKVDYERIVNHVQAGK